MSEIYWLTRLDYLIGVSIAVTVVTAILLIMFGIMEIVDGDDEIIMSSVGSGTCNKKVKYGKDRNYVCLS